MTMPDPDLMASETYDERLAVPAELLDRFYGLADRTGLWFPVRRRADGAVVVAALDPGDPAVRAEAEAAFGPGCLFAPAAERDLRWLIQDFGNRDAGRIVGAQRTALALWRNTMAEWRTRLACYRTDLARGRTGLNIMRFGLGLIALADALTRRASPDLSQAAYWACTVAGAAIAALGFRHYHAIRRDRMRPPEVQTMVEVTAVTVSFLEDFQFADSRTPVEPIKSTMLGRLGDFLCSHSTVLSAAPAHRPRIHLARERNILAAQRTISACYRTIAARARTGLSFLRTGATLTGFGLGLAHYFSPSPLSIVDGLLVLAGLAMIADGIRWYLPVRGEYTQTPRCEADLGV